MCNPNSAVFDLISIKNSSDPDMNLRKLVNNSCHELHLLTLYA